MQNSSKAHSDYFSLLASRMVILTVSRSGFGFNPAGFLPKAISSPLYAILGIFIIMPIAGEMLAAELFLLMQKITR